MKIGYLEIKWDPKQGKVLKELKNRGAFKAIKLTRELTGWGLKDSKEYVDRIRLIEKLDVNGKKISS